MKYTIREISPEHVATIDFEDGAWASVLMSKDETSVAFDARVHQLVTKQGDGLPGWVTEEDKNKDIPGGARYTANSPCAAGEWPDWWKQRMYAYGDPHSQLEFITEYGIEAWQEEVEMIKQSIPKEEFEV